MPTFIQIAKGRLSSLLPMAVAAVILAGCETATYNYDLEIDSVAAVGQRWGPTFEIKALPGSPADTDLSFGGVANIISEEMTGKGLLPKVPGKEADLIILVDYGMSPPTVVYKTVMVPAPMGVTQLDPMTGLPIRTGVGGRGTGTAPIGYVEEVRAITVFEKYMILSAVTGKIDPEAGARKEVANVKVVSADERAELEPYLPVLAMATGRQLGAPTTGEEEVTVKAPR